jgi:putative oxidoreductase
MFDKFAAMDLLLVCGVFELIFGALLLIGLFSRFSAFLLSGQSAFFAYFIGHAPKGNVLSPILNGGEPAVLFLLYFPDACSCRSGRLEPGSHARHSIDCS